MHYAAATMRKVSLYACLRVWRSPARTLRLFPHSAFHFILEPADAPALRADAVHIVRMLLLLPIQKRVTITSHPHNHLPYPLA